MAEPAERLAQPPVSSYGYGVPSREGVPFLKPSLIRGTSGNSGQYDRMLRGHPRVLTGEYNLGLALSARAPVLVGHDDETPGEAAFRETMQTACVDNVWVDAENRVRGWGRHAHYLSGHWPKGAYVGALRFVADAGATYPLEAMRGLAVECYPIDLSTIQAWETPGYGSDKFTAIKQQSGSGLNTIPYDDCVHTTRGGAIGEPEGIGLLRALVFLFERWASILQSSERNSALAGGLIVVEQGTLNGPDEAALLAMLDAIGLAWVRLPPAADGTKGAIRLEYPTGGGPSPDSLLTYIDSQIDLVFNESLQALGYSANGSRAQGEVLAEDAEWRGSAMLSQLLEAYVYDVGSWLARQLGYVGRLPIVSLGLDDAIDADARVATLASAVAAGLVTWTRADEAGVRELLGLSPLGEAVTPAPPVAAPALASATLADKSGLVEVVGADGIAFGSPCELTGVERYVEWATIDETRGELDAEITATLQRLAKQHRAEVWTAIADGWQPGERDAVRKAAEGRYLAAIVDYRTRTEAVISDHTAREMARQIAAGVPSVTAGAKSPRPPAGNIAAATILASSTVANRVQSELETAWASGATPDDFETRITPNGLSLGAQAVGNSVESVGRIGVAGDLVEEQGGGLVVTGVVRTSVRDKNRCAHCESRHGLEFELPRDQVELEARENALPDPNCAGRAERCRCGWLVIWGRR